MKDTKMLLLSLFSVVLVFSLISPTCEPGSDSITESVVDGSSTLDAMPLSTPAGNVTPMVATSTIHTVGLKADGSVIAIGQNEEGQCNVGNWTDIVHVATGYRHTVGVRNDGTVVGIGLNDYKQCNVGEWTDIIQVAAGNRYTVGLEFDGTVVSVGTDSDGQCDVGNWTDIVLVATGWYHTVGLRSDGTVVAVGDNYYGQCNVGNWTDIVQVTAGSYHTVGVRGDGTVVAVGDNYYGQCNVGDWTNIIQVTAGYGHTVGVKSDDTVVAVGDNGNGQCNVGGWTDIMQVAAGWSGTVGLKNNGTVVAVGSYCHGQLNVGDWTDITQVATGYDYTVGLKSEGTVVAIGMNQSGQCNVDGWTNIIQIAAGEYHTVGVKSDGTVVAVGHNFWWQCNVDGWTNIVQVDAGRDHTVGVKDDGTAVAVYYNNYGQCNVGGWTNIVQVAAGHWHTVGLKADGTVASAGWNYFGQGDVGGWADINQVAEHYHHTVGVRDDGTVVAVGSNSSGECNVGNWTDITQVSAGDGHTVGLRANGTVVAVGQNYYGQCNVGEWTDIIQVAAGYHHTVGLESDGTVVAAGFEAELTKWNLGETAPPPDTTPPTVSSVFPENGANDVSDSINITATFSEPMDGSTINTESVTLVGSAVSGTVTYDPATHTATFTPDADLEYDHTYTAMLSTAIADLAGNPLAEPYTWSFATLTLAQYKAGASIAPGTPTYQLAHTGTRLKYFVTVANQGCETDTIEVEAQGDPDLDWLIMLVPSWDGEYPSTPVDNNKFQVVLPPGESTDYYVYVDIGTGANSIDISAKSMGDPDESTNCAVKAWSLTPGSGLFVAELLFENLSEEGDTLIFNVPTNAMISKSSISLGPSEQEWIRVMYDPTSVDETYDTWVGVYSMHSGDEITIPMEFGPYYDVATTGFEMAQDSYDFENLLGFLCYGMSETSILYYQGELSLPAGKPNTYSLTQAEALRNIVWHHRLFGRNSLAGIKLKLGNVDLAEEYSKLKTGMQDGKPMILAVEGHAVVAYRIFETGSKSYIYIYDSERPYNPPGDEEWSDSFFLAFPYATYDLVSHEFNYSDSFDEFLALEAETLPMEDLPMVIIVACPVDVTVTDQFGHIIDNLDTNEIPEAWFAAFGEEKYFFLPKDLAYFVHIDAYGEGEFSLAVLSPIAHGEALIIHFPHTSVNATTLADFEIVPHAQSYAMEIDYDGDGIIDELRYPDVYEILEPEPQIPGCFIATAAYGTPMAEEIQILREFRNGYLMTNVLGQAFVDFYYSTSPPIAEFITEHSCLKPIVRAALVPAVAMSTMVVNTTLAEKMAIVGLLLASAALAVWATRRRRDPNHT